MAAILEITIGCLIAVVALCLGIDAILAIQRRHKVESPPCYVCDAPDALDDGVAGLPACVECSIRVEMEVDGILDPFKEARDQEERRLAGARAVTDFATKFGMLPPRPIGEQALAMRLGAPIEVLQGQGRKAIVARRAI